jgi:hypothetical protein
VYDDFNEDVIQKQLEKHQIECSWDSNQWERRIGIWDPADQETQPMRLLRTQELLVDLTYCVHEDSLYCERHYAER